LDVGKRCRIGVEKQFKPFPAYENEAQVSDEFLVMLLADAKEIHHLAVEIVQDFYLAWRLLEENLGAARKNFTIREVLWENVNDLLRNRAFPADVSKWSPH
jgi:hypothetical protein